MNPPFVSGAVCHVLLCETDVGLALVDTGLGTFDYSDPSRMGPVRHLMRPEMNEANSAIRQVEELGFEAADVTHIVLTHMDFDHIGGLSDFPDAIVHTTADEYSAAVTDPDFLDRRRYRPRQWAHGPHFRTHEGRGDEWKFGLTAHGIDELPGIVMIPMPGHSRGLAAIAIDAGECGLLIHAGDAVFDGSIVADRSPLGQPLKRVGALRFMENVVGRDRKAIKVNHSILRRLQSEDGVIVIPAHDRRIFHDLKKC